MVVQAATPWKKIDTLRKIERLAAISSDTDTRESARVGIGELVQFFEKKAD